MNNSLDLKNGSLIFLENTSGQTSYAISLTEVFHQIKDTDSRITYPTRVIFENKVYRSEIEIRDKNDIALHVWKINEKSRWFKIKGIIND